MVKEIFIGIGIVIFATILGSIGALLFKIATKTTIGSFFKIFKNPSFYAGMLLYAVSALFFVYALTLGELSTLYSLVSLSYVWTVLFSWIFLKEKINGYKIMGIILIIIAVIFISLGA